MQECAQCGTVTEYAVTAGEDRHPAALFERLLPCAVCGTILCVRFESALSQKLRAKKS